MNKEILKKIDKLEQQLNGSFKCASFYLYNTKYLVKNNNGNITIQNSGSNNIKSYSSIEDMFSNYYVYGSSLQDSLDKMIIDKID